MNQKKVLRRVKRKSTQPPLQYVVSYSVTTQLVKSPLDETAFQGLQYSYVSQATNRSHVVSVWDSEEYYLASATAVEHLLGPSTQLDSAGRLTDWRFPRTPLYRRVPVYTIVLGIAAILGALQAIGNHYDWIFRAPQLEMVVSDSQTDFVEGASTLIGVSVTNPLPIAQRDLKFSATWGGSDVAIVKPTEVAHLPLGAKREFFVSSPSLSPGRYTLHMVVSSKAGTLRRRRELATEQEIRIWPKMPSATIALSKVQHDTAFFDGTVVVGQEAPNGLYCDLAIIGHAGLRHGALTFPGRTGEVFFNSTGARGQEAALLNWASEHIAGQRELRFRVILIGPPATDWSEVARDSQVVCTFAGTE